MRPIFARITLLFVFMCACLDAQTEGTNPLFTLPASMQPAVLPYLIPNGHPMKQNLDRIFTATRASFDTEAALQAGFEILYVKERSFIRVARHPLLPKHLIKVYFDTEMRRKYNKSCWSWLLQRCIGAKQVRKAIKKEKSKYFQVAKKWLYILPEAVCPQCENEGVEKQPLLLLVEDMDLVSKEENLDAWENQITKRHLDELFQIITRANGSSYRASNIWLSKNGKFSFIDTEYPNRKRGYDGIRSYLSTEMRAYWDSLVESSIDS